MSRKPPPPGATAPSREPRRFGAEHHARPPEGGELIAPGHTMGSVTDAIAGAVVSPALLRRWLVGFSVAFLLLMVFLFSIGWLLARGVGIWGVNVPVAWGFAIINFVWWIGIGHAGTLISAILLLMRQPWRTSINRFAEAMTLFAVACAGIFPLLHLGRPWLFYWLVPYPSNMGVWPQFRSPLVWDIFAVTTYATVSLLFWYLGAVPDFATMRDRAKRRAGQILFGIAALGWRGSARHWKRHQTAYLLLAGLATPLVVSVHSIVSFDFTISQLPGWHSTIFPPYFVAGAIFSGFAMVLTLVIPVRAWYRLHDFVTPRHIDAMAKVMLASGWVVTYGYVAETFFSYYSGSEFHTYMIENRMAGAYAPVYWATIALNSLVPQLLWFPRVRRSVPAVFAVAMGINVGMWTERYVIVVQSLHRDFLPSSWDMYSGTFWDWATFLGSIGLFLSLLFLFLRFVPVISMSELREDVPANELREDVPAQRPERSSDEEGGR